MGLGTVRLDDEGGREEAAVAAPGGAPVLVRDIPGGFPRDLLALIASGRAAEAARAAGGARPFPGRWSFAPPLRRPGKILGIGLNFRAHADDLGAARPEDEPASFFKPASTIIGPGDPIRLPPCSSRVTAEAEIAVVLAKPAKDLDGPEAARVAVLGFLPILDMTAEDILRRNPRFLTRAKSFDTFLALGPWIVGADELPRPLAELRVSTRLGGAVVKAARVADMRFSPLDLVAFHSRVFPWEPGDLLLCGTPGAVAIRPGDEAVAEVEGVGEVRCPVR